MLNFVLRVFENHDYNSMTYTVLLIKTHSPFSDFVLLFRLIVKVIPIRNLPFLRNENTQRKEKESQVNKTKEQ